MDNLEEFECYDHLLFAPMANMGWEVEEISWREKGINWNRFDVVVIRSPWDYQQAPDEFLATLEEIDQSSALLENSLQLIKWNIDKNYLRDLQQWGLEIVPTLWKKSFNSRHLSGFFDQLDTEEIIIKPTVSANADDTFRINRMDSDDSKQELAALFTDRSFMVQPFMSNIVEEGEFSLFFFGETYSHTILKTPEAGDFRVQEEHGGKLKKIEPEKSLLELAHNLLGKLGQTPLYSRIDYVRTTNDSFALMELELIEPSLYFNMDADSPQRFARVFNERMKQRLP